MGNMRFLQWGLVLSSLMLSACVSGPVVLAGAGGAVAANSAGSSVSAHQQVDDLEIRSKIYTILNNMSGLNNANVEVTVFNGIVLLLGQIPSQELRQDLLNQVSALKGVVIVYNQLVIGPNEPLSQFTHDSWITSKVITSITMKVNPVHFKVVTQDSVVYLLGQVTHEEGDLAVAQTRKVKGVKSVVRIFNYIKTSPATPTTFSADEGSAGPAASD